MARSAPTASLSEHPAARLLPGLGEREYAALRQGVRAQGILVPLEITAEGLVLDGRHRLRLALELGIARLPVRVVTPRDEVEHMLLSTLQRRHLGQSQKACLAVELHHHQQAGDPQAVATLPPAGRYRDHLAQLTGVSGRLIQDALTLHATDPQLFTEVKQGRLPLHRACRQLRRAQRYAQIGEAPPVPAGPFDLIYADPPWQLGNPDGPWAPEQHYPTLPLAAIKNLPLPAAQDAVLFLWVPSSLIPQGLELVAAWGFQYRSSIVWVKPWIGLGQWTRNRHEWLLINRRGKQAPPEPEDRVDSVLEAPRGRHSEKPQLTYELLERMYPHARKLELYARGRPRPGWTTWGNQAESNEAA